VADRLSVPPVSLRPSRHPSVTTRIELSFNPFERYTTPLPIVSRLVERISVLSVTESTSLGRSSAWDESEPSAVYILALERLSLCCPEGFRDASAAAEITEVCTCSTHTYNTIVFLLGVVCFPVLSQQSTSL